MFDRIKEKKKKTSDQKKLERNFQNQCNKTGGGPAPHDLPAEDRDEEDLLDFDDLTPVETDWNKFTGADDRENIPPSNKQYSCSSLGQSPSSQSRPASAGPSRGRRPSCSITAPRLLSPPVSTGIRSPSSAGQSIRTPTSSSSQATRTSSTFSPTVHDEELPEVQSNRIEMFTNNGRESVVVEAVPEPVKKVKKANKKKVNMNEEAGTYYSEMLVMEKRLFKLKERFLLRKLRVEMSKEKLLMKHLIQEGGSVPELMDSDLLNDDLSSDDDFDEED